MTDVTTSHPAAEGTHGARPDGLTPAGIQPVASLVRRRAFTLLLNLALMALLTAGIAAVFGHGGWQISDIVIVTCFVIGVPWTVMGAVNALIGLWLLHGRRDGAMAAAPHLAAGQGDAPIATRTAVAMTLRNEPPEASFDKLIAIRRQLDATGYGRLFDIFVLSDTTDPAVAKAEEALFHRLRGRLGGAGASYRRRARNTGFKAGNVREFLLNEGRHYPLYLPLDSDSLMGGEDVVRLVRIMEAYPKIGILQTLAVGIPAHSLFARLFQFGMRHGMRSFTLGAAWWQGDSGPYWGHNALIRSAAFRRHCRLPVLPGEAPLGGHIMSHDQVEAALMRRAGWEVRVLPVEGASYEENPPTVLDFAKRDLRWCQGNMQYWQILGLRGLTPVSRLQLFAAVAMYLGAPAWMLMTLAALSKLVVPDPGGLDLAIGIPMFFAMLTMSFVPKIAGLLDVALTPGGVARYGGRARFAAGAVGEALFSVLLAPVMALSVTIFLVGLLFGRRVMWGGQRREAYGLAWAEAAEAYWPQTLLGLAIAALTLGISGVGLFLWAAPLVLGLALAIPFAVLTASPRVGGWCAGLGLAAVPDERRPTGALVDLAGARTAGAALPEAA
ncbi:MAG: glucans biosynthesis glucosyltransferase MdoH [Pseudomonadota bacterium]